MNTRGRGPPVAAGTRLQSIIIEVVIKIVTIYNICAVKKKHDDSLLNNYSRLGEVGKF